MQVGSEVGQADFPVINQKDEEEKLSVIDGVFVTHNLLGWNL
jgi:hypothetical protein